MNEQNTAVEPLYPVGIQDFEKLRRNNYLTEMFAESHRLEAEIMQHGSIV
jgi:hypothetical protein